MSGKRRAVEKSVEEILVDLMNERVIYVGIQASSNGVLQASPSARQRFVHTAEKRSKHRNDMANMKQISSVLPDYIPQLDGAVSYDNIP